MTYNWHEHWESNNIAFHLNTFNPLLEKYWPQLNLAPKSTVLVPLCGKTMDMLWLANLGHQVIGAELSEIACKAFFHENKLEFKTTTENTFNCYYNENIKLYCGDFFALSSKMIPEIDAVYDRAALIALPTDLRQCYAKHLTTLMTPNSQMLLLTLDSPDTVQGPPFPVSADEVNRLYASEYQISELFRIQKHEIANHLINKGYKVIDESVYKLKRK